MISFAPYVITINPGVPAKTVAEFIAYGKANPGKVLFANPGIGLANHLTNIQVAKAWGIDVKHVPFKGGSEAMKSVASGETPLDDQQHSDLGRLSFEEEVRRHRLVRRPAARAVQGPADLQGARPAAGRQRQLAGAADHAGCPPALVTRLNAELVKILAMPDISKRLNDLGAQVKVGPPSELWLAG